MKRSTTTINDVKVVLFHLNDYMNVVKGLSGEYITLCSKCNTVLTKGHKKLKDVAADIANLKDEEVRKTNRNHLKRCFAPAVEETPVAPTVQKEYRYHLIGSRYNTNIMDQELHYGVKGKPFKITVDQVSNKCEIVTNKAKYTLGKVAERTYHHKGDGIKLHLTHGTWVGKLVITLK